jgi:hypothetical protein
MELLCEMVPKAAIIAVLMDPKFATELPAIEAAGRALGRQILVLNAASESELDAAFSQMVQAGTARCWSAAVHSSLAKAKGWSGWRRVMPFRRFTIRAITSKPAV